MHDCAHVNSEKSALKLRNALLSFATDRLVYLRTELAKKHSNVDFLGIDARLRESKSELTAFSVMAGDEMIHCNWMNLSITHHALERVQERRKGVVHAIAPMADEFAPAALAAFVSSWEAMKSEGVPSDELLPTSTGILITKHEPERSGWIGVTWVSDEQLRPEQMVVKNTMLLKVLTYMETYSKTKVRKTFSGRNDSIQLLLRPTAKYTF